MADFSTKSTDVTTAIEPSAVILQPVDRGNEIDALRSIGQGVAQGASVLGGFMKQQKAADTGKSLANFSIELNDLQDAFDQGSISTSEYGMRRRALLKQRLADTPALEEDLLKRYSTFREQNGLAGVDSPGVQAAKLRQDAVQGAVNNGFLPINKVGDQQAEETAIQNLGQFNTSVRQLKEQSDRIGLEKSKLELGSSQRSAKDAEAKQVVEGGLAKIGRDGLPYWRTQYDNIKVRATQASNEMERRQIISEGLMKMDQDFAQRAAAISGDSLGIEQGKIDQVLKPQQDLIAAYKKELNGEYDTETFNRYVDASQARAKAMAMDGLDENTKQWIAISEIAKSAPGAFNNQILTGVTAAFGKNAKASGTNPDGKPYDVLPMGTEETKDVKSYLGVLTNTLEDWNKGKFNNKSPEEKALLESELADQVKSILKGVDVHSNATESAKEFQPVIDFFSNPSVGAYLKGKGLDPEAQSRVAQVLQDGYASQVVPMLKSELGESMFNQIRVGSQVMRYDQLVEPTMKSGRFGFQLKPEFQDSFAARSTLKALNESSFTKVMNKMIMSDANIRGDGNYQKSYDETFGPAVFPAEQGDAGGEQGDASTKKEVKTSIGNFPGEVEQGNIDLNARPVVTNEDGSVSTVRSMSFNEDGVEVLIPTVSPDGKVLSDEDAIKLYQDSGQFLGKFETPDAATNYAETLHQEQEQQYVDPSVSVETDFDLNDLVKMDNFAVPTESGTMNEGLKKAASGSFTGPADNFINESDPIKIASSFKGMSEKTDADVIASFIKKSTGTNINPASTAWCAAFVNAVLGATGGKGTGKLNARSFLDWGKPVNTPTQGDVVVFSRGSPNGWSGHVGFFKGFEEKNGEQYIRVLGGNQSNSVKESLYPASKLLGVRRAA